MTRHSLRVRFTLALVLGGLLMSVMASPASASHRTRWVDDDSKNGDGPNACDNANFSTIQAAIDASHAWDRVFVCPGNYTEQLTIDVTGLEVRSVPALGAKLYPPETLTEVESMTSLVTVDAPHVTLSSFRMNILDGDLISLVPDGCANLDAAIWARAPHANIKANHIRATGDNTYSGACGYNYGIVIDEGAEPAGLPAPSYPASLVWRNWIMDFKAGGILVGPGSSAKLLFNHLRFVHLFDPATCNLVPVIGVSPSLIFPCVDLLAQVGEGINPLNGIFPYSVGILVEGAKVNIRGNSIYSTIDTAIIEGPVPVVLIAGIVLLDPVDNSKVTSNLIDNVGAGIIVAEEGDITVLPVLPLPEAPDGVAFSGNRIWESVVGMLVAASDGIYFGNRAHLNLVGLLALDGADNEFVANDFRHNIYGDCIDETSGAGTLSTANSWESFNLGFINSPSDLCFPYSPITP